MQYDLLRDRGLQPNEDMPLMSFFLMYSMYTKERMTPPGTTTQ